MHLSPTLWYPSSLQLMSLVHLRSRNLYIRWGCVHSCISTNFRRLGMRLVDLRILGHTGLVVPGR
jgi:hypothetical protein